MREETQRDYAHRILSVLVHIQEHLDEPLDLDALAHVACFSPFHFHRVFKGMVGESASQHVRRLRLERAAQRLKHTDDPVTSIALEAGYEAHEAFTRAFHGAFGCPPSTFRSAQESSTSLAAPARVHFGETPQEAFAPLGERGEMHVEVRTIGPMRVAFVRHVGPYDGVGEAWTELTDWAGGECLFGPKTQLLGASWDDPEVTPPERIRYDACVTVDESVRAAGNVGIQTLGGGRYAVLLHEGPYERLHEAYEALLGRWFAGSRLEPGDAPSLEIYLNDPGSAEPEDLLTEVCVRIRD